MLNNDDTLTAIFSHLPRRYLQVAINRQWERVYRQHHAQETGIRLIYDTTSDRRATALVKWQVTSGQLTEYNARTLTLYLAICGFTQTLEWILEQGVELHDGACQHAAANGHLITLQFIVKHNDGQYRDDVIEAAAALGHLHVLKWLARHNRDRDDYLSDKSLKRYTREIARLAALNGHVQILNWISSIVDWYPDNLFYQYCAASSHDTVKGWARNRDAIKYEQAKVTVNRCGGNIIIINGVW
jgi:hypothetical protein